MKKSAKIYIVIISFLGIIPGLLACWDYFSPFLLGEAPFRLHMYLIPLLICALCRSFPINIRDDETLDLSVICTLAVYLTQGAPAAVSIYMLSSFLSFEPSSDGKGYQHVFKIGMQKVLFNTATVILSILLPGLFMKALIPWEPGSLSFPMVLVPTALFSILTYVINALLQLCMFCLNGMLSPVDMLHMLFGLAPNVIAAMPMGLMMGFGYSSETFIWFMFLMMFPLLLARYAWKLYAKSENARANLIKAFINTIEAKDKYTQGHSERVAAYAVQIAKEMSLKRQQIKLIQQGAVLHDIGKLGISDLILNKPGKLTDEEMSVIQQHPLIGVRVLESVDLEPEVIEMVRSHHERYDGAGYPDHTPSSQRPLTVRILCVADAYDAMTSDRPYRKGMKFEKVREILLECRGTQFDPDVVDAFLRSMEKQQ